MFVCSVTFGWSLHPYQVSAPSIPATKSIHPRIDGRVHIDDRYVSRYGQDPRCRTIWGFVSHFSSPFGGRKESILFVVTIAVL